MCEHTHSEEKTNFLDSDSRHIFPSHAFTSSHKKPLWPLSAIGLSRSTPTLITSSSFSFPRWETKYPFTPSVCASGSKCPPASSQGMDGGYPFLFCWHVIVRTGDRGEGSWGHTEGRRKGALLPVDNADISPSSFLLNLCKRVRQEKGERRRTL